MAPRGPPLFSIVIPTFNRPRQVARCLRGLDRLDYPRDRFEVIFVDDGSERAPTDEIARYRDRLDVVLLPQQHAGAAAARNAGADRASGRFVVFTDDDCVPAPDLLQSLAQQFDRTPDCLVGGKVVNALPDNRYAAASQMLLDYLYEYYNAVGGSARFLASMNIAMPRERFVDLGGFDSAFAGAGGEDRELCYRWLARGWPMVCNPQTIIYHAHDLTAKGYWRQHFNYGKGAHKFHQRHKRLSGKTVAIEPLSFYAGLLRKPFRSSAFPRSLSMFALICLSQYANALGYFYARYSGRAKTDG